MSENGILTVSDMIKPYKNRKKLINRKSFVKTTGIGKHKEREDVWRNPSLALELLKSVDR